MPEKPKCESCSVSSGDAGCKGAYNRQKYKSEICKYWENGNCPYGKKCIFAHGAEELRNLFRHKRLYKTKACATWSCQHYCPYGTKCQFAHSRASTDVPLWAHCVSILAHTEPFMPEQPLSPGRRLSVFQRLCSVN